MSTAKPMQPGTRAFHYINQTQSLVFTPRQSRRFLKKLNRLNKVTVHADG